MATEDIVGGLFGINPAMYQQQQQQQVFNRAVAMQNLDPFQQAAVGYQQAGYNLAGALGGALGGVDPQLQRISTLNAISKQIDQTNPESMLQGAKLLADAGFMQEALGLAQYARKANSEIALAKQRMNEGRAAAIPKEVQIAEYTATLRNAIRQLQAGPQSPETDNQIAELQGRLDALPQPKEVTQNADVFKAQRAGQIVNQLAVIRALPKEQQSPEAIRALETELAVLNPPKEGTKSELTRLIAERAQAQASGASPQILADYDAAIKKQSTFAPPMQVTVPIAVEDPNRPGSVIYVDKSEAIGKTPATAIEGLGPKEIQAREAKYPQAITALKGFNAKTFKLERDIDDLIKNTKGLNEITGFFAGRTDLSAMSNAGRRALAVFNTITAKGGFSELQDMRNASPTGGALGNVSNTEGQQLISSFGALSRTQNADDLRNSLTTIKNDLKGSKQRVKEAFDETYSYRANRDSATAPAATISRGVDINNPLLKN